MFAWLSPVLKQNILHLWALCGSNWIKILNGYLSFRKFEQLFHFFLRTAGYVAVLCLQLVVCVVCTPSHVFSLHKHKKSRRFTDQIRPSMFLSGFILQNLSFFISLLAILSMFYLFPNLGALLSTYIISRFFSKSFSHTESTLATMLAMK